MNRDMKKMIKITTPLRTELQEQLKAIISDDAKLLTVERLTEILELLGADHGWSEDVCIEILNHMNAQELRLIQADDIIASSLKLMEEQEADMNDAQERIMKLEAEILAMSRPQ